MSRVGVRGAVGVAGLRPPRSLPVHQPLILVETRTSKAVARATLAGVTWTTQGSWGMISSVCLVAFGFAVCRAWSRNGAGRVTYEPNH